MIPRSKIILLPTPEEADRWSKERLFNDLVSVAGAECKECTICGHRDAADALKCDECGYDLPATFTDK